MAAAKLTVSPVGGLVQSGTTISFAANVTGLLANLNGDPITWDAATLEGCAVQPNNALKDTASGDNGWDTSGGLSEETIDSGEGYAEFVANVPDETPPFGGRVFYAGLTSQASCVEFAELDFGILLSLDIVAVYEFGVQKRRLFNPRSNGVYRVGVEDNQIIFRADGAILYRSDQPFDYPLRFGAQFYHRGSDVIGGTPVSTSTFSCRNEAGELVAAISGGDLFTAPDARGRYKIIAESSDFLYGSTFVSVQKRYPDEFSVVGLKPASKFLPLTPEWKVNKQEFDDRGVATNLAYPSVAAVRKWRLEYNPLSEAAAAIFDEFYEEHRGETFPFYFYDKRADFLYDNCRITRYDRDHRKRWLQRRIVEITYTPR